MTDADIDVVHQFVDNALDYLRQTPIMRGPQELIPLEMQEDAEEDEEGNVPWKAIPSTVTAADIEELESRLNLRYPALYKQFLGYQHFWELLPVDGITFFRHSIREWKKGLLDHYFGYPESASLVAKGYIPFADYFDWGVVYFDTNHQNQPDKDCPVVMLDHELFYDEPLPMKMLYPSFAAMMHSLVAQQGNPKPPED
ncbi:SMI1/KNR4 family protein [Hymenobacter sp. CRA2]|uniref:SMI1/KNR4 family protein n=1 Tax=Hymenobacter sp. CRA2 TaxID=1955620 RepID=UPI0009C982D1|nr:SMI1/KNR4 family protein [Hymenobacter sp. CRA2]OON69725.1 hypothetical protein B0919_07300 [Hymenobacter sp. CRA2]